MSDNIVNVTDDSFAGEVLESKLPTLVDYWAEWCGPCKMIAPVLEEIADDYAGRLKVCKLDVDQNPKNPVEHSVRGIPTLILFRDGKVETRKVGALSKSQLVQMLDSIL